MARFVIGCLVFLLIASTQVARADEAATKAAQANATASGATAPNATASATGNEKNIRKSPGLQGEELEKALKKAREAQNRLQRTEVVAHLVKEAAAAQVNAGTGDLDTTGACQEAIQMICPRVEPGMGRLAECIGNQLADEKSGNAGVSRVPPKCVKALKAFRVAKYRNINRNLPMALACATDAHKFCSDLASVEVEGKILACLREVKEQLSSRCKQHIVRAQLDAAKDYEMDALLAEACKDDAARLCPDKESGEGAVQECLRSRRPQVGWACQEELFRQEVENVDDLRLSTKLFKACMQEKRKFCPEVEPGNARAKECLEEKREQAGFGENCRGALEEMMEGRARDFRLDTRLRESCLDDIESVCAMERDALAMAPSTEARVIECLQDFKDELTSPSCRKAVFRTLERASADIRFDASLADACSSDRHSLCKNIPPGDARVIRCLQGHREQLQHDCRAVLFDEEVRMSESIEFQLPLKGACQQELQLFCSGVPDEKQRVLHCLEDSLGKEDFGPACKKEVRRFQRIQARDFRMNTRLTRACEGAITSMCSAACDFLGSETACGGRVLRCLTDKRDDITEIDCQAEVDYFIKMEVSDFGNDVILAEACRSDVDQFCAKVEPGDGHIHVCLRNHYPQLTPACRKEEQKLEALEALSIDFRPGLKKACAEERQLFCGTVKVGDARIFRCLVDNLETAGFGRTCRDEVTRKLQRRQQNWKLDVNLRRRCKGEVKRICAEVDHDSDHAETLRCLISQVAVLESSCAAEVARAVHAALLVWQGGAPITKVCDGDINRTCLSKQPSMSARPGHVLQCLQEAVGQEEEAYVKQPVGEECKQLLAVAVPSRDKQEFEVAMAKVAFINKLQNITSLQLIDQARGSGMSAITLHGWTALLAVTALATVLVLGAVALYRRVAGYSPAYTMVLKSRPSSRG